MMSDFMCDHFWVLANQYSKVNNDYDTNPVTHRYFRYYCAKCRVRIEDTAYSAGGNVPWAGSSG